MLNREHLAILLVAVLVAALGGWLQHASRAAHSPPGVTPVGIGQPAPALDLPDLDGRQHRLTEQRGRRVLVNFWATWCAPCLKELPALAAAQEKFGEKHAIVLAVAMDEPERVRRFIADHGLRLPVLLGDMGPPSTSLKWGDRDEILPFSVLVDGDGRVIAMHRGPLDDARIARWLQTGRD